jgi:hypothetical protein
MKKLLLAAVAAIALIVPTATSASAGYYGRWGGVHNWGYGSGYGWRRPIVVNPYGYSGFCGPVGVPLARWHRYYYRRHF